MDIAASVYSKANVDVPPRPDIYIDEDAESQERCCKSTVIVEPRPLSSIAEGRDDKSPQDSEFGLRKSANRKKHESYDLSGSVFLVTSDGKTLSLPVPSDSEHDPLNWGRWKFIGAFVSLVWFVAFSTTAVQAAAQMIHGIGKEFDQTDNGPWSLETLATAPTLFMAIGAFLWIPLTLALGRRPTFLLATVVNFSAILGAGFARTFEELLGCICVMGLCVGFGLTVATLMVIDMTYIHQRVKAITALWAFSNPISTSCLVLVPRLSDHGEEWRDFYRWWSILACIAIVLAFAFCPESYFKRPTVAFNGLILLQTATEKLTVHDDKEKDSDLYRDLPGFPFDDPDKRSIFQHLGLARSPFGSFTSMGRCYLQIIFCFANPLLFWVFFASSFNFAGMMFIGTTFPQTLAAPPYFLPSSTTVNVNITSGMGGLFTYFTVGYITTECLKRLSKRNNGVREAEHYLICFIPAVVAGALSTLIYGLAVDRQWPLATYHLAYGLNGFSWVSLSVSNILWVTEAFPRWAAPAIAVVSGGSYFLGFSISFALVPWIKTYGYMGVGVQLTALQLVGGLIALPIAFWGKSARQIIHGRWANERSGALRPL